VDIPSRGRQRPRHTNQGSHVLLELKLK